MTERDVYAPFFGRPVADWHNWFAWRPVTTMDRVVRWMRVVRRRRIQKLLSLPGGTDFWFQYAVDVRSGQ